MRGTVTRETIQQGLANCVGTAGCRTCPYKQYTADCTIVMMRNALQLLQAEDVAGEICIRVSIPDPPKSGKESKK